MRGFLARLAVIPFCLCALVIFSLTIVAGLTVLAACGVKWLITGSQFSDKTCDRVDALGPDKFATVLESWWGDVERWGQK